jgi:hypothetical protein
MELKPQALPLVRIVLAVTAKPDPRTLPEDNLSVRAIRELESQLKETT